MPLFLNQSYYYHADIRFISNVLVIRVSCVPNARQLMILKKKDIIFHLLSMVHPRKGRGKMIHVNLLGVQKRKPSFVSCPSAQLEKYQLVPLPKVLTWEEFRINSINYIMRLMMRKKRGIRLIEI